MKRVSWVFAGLASLGLGASGFVACSNGSTDTGGGDLDSGLPGETGADTTTRPDGPVFGGDTGPLADSPSGADTGNGDTGDNGDAGSDAALDDGATDGGASDASDSGTLADSSSDGGSAECGTIPTLHPSDGGPGSLYCPFGDGGVALHCSPDTEHCCINPKVNNVFPPSTCELNTTGCLYDGGTNVECEDPNDCNGRGTGYICCGSPNSIQPVAGCGYDKLTGWKYTQCTQAAACSTGEFRVCTSDAQCSGGQTCTAFKAKGVQLGFCL